MNIKEEIKFIKENSNKNFNNSVIFATIILFIYCYFGSFSFFEKFNNIKNIDYWKIIYHNFMAFFLFFVVGIIFTKLCFKSDFKSFGLSLGNKKFGFIIIGLATILVPLTALTTVLSKDMSLTYPLIDFNIYNSWWQILIYFISYFAYYVGWEYLFRGILFFGSKEKVGVLGTILLTTMISALIHTCIAGFGKPLIETLSAIPAGLIFGFVAYKSNSIYYSLYIHCLVGFLTDIFIFLI